MRPPQNAGEILRGLVTIEQHHYRFNEAPAKRGGNRPDADRRRNGRPGFNEAPAKRGGNRLVSTSPGNVLSRFNEAPAKRGGNLQSPSPISPPTTTLQ